MGPKTTGWPPLAALLCLALASGTAYGVAYLKLRRAHRIVHSWDSCSGHSVGPGRRSFANDKGEHVPETADARVARWFWPLMRAEACFHTLLRGRGHGGCC